MDEELRQLGEAQATQAARWLNANNLPASVVVEAKVYPGFDLHDAFPWLEAPAKKLGLHLLAIPVLKSTPTGSEELLCVILSIKSRLSMQELIQVFKAAGLVYQPMLQSDTETL